MRSNIEALLKQPFAQESLQQMGKLKPANEYTPEEIEEKLEKLRGVLYAEAQEVRECVLSLIEEPADSMYTEIDHDKTVNV